MMRKAIKYGAASPMDSPIISVSHVYKRYPLNEYRASLRHEPMKAIRSLLGMPSDPGDNTPFWALQDVSFTVQKGQAVGIIGRNGAGKSTLFRLLSNVTSPTQGEVHVYGKFVALIALGTGFNVERTGLENIYLNAAIYGMPPDQIKPMIGDIIAFSELESFISVPVKRYSGGMVARLGFSVAVHLAPDIVFIDEVLSVGDSAFQKKCVNRILEMKAQGRTLMFVSHNVTMVEQLCERAIWLDHGKVLNDGPVLQVVKDYERDIRQ